MNWIANVLISIGTVLGVVNWISALFIHVMTIMLTYKVSGMIAAVLTLIFPIVSALYWFVVMWIKTGSAFDNPYGHWIGVFLMYLAVSIGLMVAGSAMKRD